MLDYINDITNFLAVASERSFTRAAAKRGVSQSALSHSVRSLESRLGVRLLTRTTRSVGMTEAGERLMRSITPRLAEIEAELAAVSEMSEKVAGTIRITAIDHVVEGVVWPRLEGLLHRYPELKMLKAALSGHGLAFLTEDLVRPHVQAGHLKQVMAEWCPSFPGLHAYYTSRRHPTRALTTVIDALREPVAD